MVTQVTFTRNFTFVKGNSSHLPLIETGQSQPQETKWLDEGSWKNSLAVGGLRGHSLALLPHTTHSGGTACRSQTLAWWPQSAHSIWLRNCHSVCPSLWKHHFSVLPANCIPRLCYWLSVSLMPRCGITCPPSLSYLLTEPAASRGDLGNFRS